MTTNRDHLDAETVAAWIDGGLDAASLAAAEAHASNCDRCQMLLATVATTLPAEASSGLKAAAAPATPGMWRWWFAPLAASAAAVTLWMVVPQDPMQAPAAPAPRSEIAATTPQSAPTVGEPAPKPASPTPAEARLSDAPRVEAGKDTQTKESKALADAAQSNRIDAAGDRDRQEKREAPLERAAEAPPTQAPPPAAPAIAAAEPARYAAAGAQLGAVSQLRKQAAPLEFASPDASHRWRFATAGVEFSRDGGRTWAAAQIRDGGSLVAGASPAPQVGWIVGRRGLVLLTTDGTNFTRLPFPEAIDLTSVLPLDATRATVAAVDGRTFQTDDSGQNWRIR